MAGEHNFTVEQGATWQRVLIVKDGGVARDLTGYDARMQVRRQPSSSDVYLTLTVGDGISIPTPANGQIILELSDEETAVLQPVTRYRYDLELVDGAGKVERLLEGTFSVRPEVTRDDDS